MRIPLATNLKIEDFVSGVILTWDRVVKNGIFSKREDNSFFLTQRPAVNIVEDCSATVSDVRGRGCYYWGLAGALYIVNAGEVYKDSYSATVREAAQSVTSITSVITTATVTITAHGYATGDTVVITDADQTEYNGSYTITVTGANTFTYVFAGSATSPATGTISARRAFNTGINRVYIHEVGTYLVFLDPENGEGWYVTSAADTVLNKITDTDFPTDLERGGVVLNGRLYVIGNDGTLYASDENDPTAWGSLNTIVANHSPDVGLFAEIHNKHIAVFGANTIEYFYDNGNPTGSPLSKRIDLIHEVGTISEDTIWTDNNGTFFIGISRTGGLSVYLMAGFQIKEVSTSEIDSFITTAYMKESKHFFASGAVVGGRVFYILTVYQKNPDGTPLTTLVFNAQTQTWTVWDLMHTGITGCPLVAWTLSTSSTTTKGILVNGDIVTFQDDLNPQDLTLAFGPFESGIFEAGNFVESGGVGDPIYIEAITGARNYGTMNRKRMDSLRLVGNRTALSQEFTISTSDEVNDDYVDAGTIDISIQGERVTRMGAFSQRNIKISGSPSERVEIDALEVEVQGLSS